MSDRHLTVLLGGRVMGSVGQGPGGRLRFSYEEAWRRSRNAMPLSLSMPLAAAEHGHEVVDAFLHGLLPDNDEVLRRWGQRYHASPRNAFALLSHVGEDCAGAVQLVRHDRLEAVLSDEAWEIEWISEAEVGERLRALGRDGSAWRTSRDTGQFSLAGAQPKTALLFEEGRWGVPSGRAPTTHILKPPIPEYDGHVENEHFCLSLAGVLGLPVARSHVRWFGDQVAIVVERFDRGRTAELAESAAAEPARGALAKLSRSLPILRLHQEDVCQALAVPPILKYQNEGGPSPVAVVELLRGHSSRPTEDVRTFVDALVFNWLVAGTDAHAKNYSILHGGGGRVRLGPLYDLATALPYDDLDPQRIRLAMKIGGKYRSRDVGYRQWEKLADELHLDSAATLDRIEATASRLPDSAARVRDRVIAAGLTHPIIDRISERITARAETCLRTFRAR